MNMDKFFLYAMAVIFIILLVGIIRGIQAGNAEYREVTEACKETQMFIFTEHGFKRRVYDCTGVEVKP